MDHWIVTNNDVVKCEVPGDVALVEGHLVELLIVVRDMIHKGHRLVNDVSGGKLERWVNPYCSAVLSREPGGSIDTMSLERIETALTLARRASAVRGEASYENDFKLMDLELLTAVLDVSGRSGSKWRVVRD